MKINLQICNYCKHFLLSKSCFQEFLEMMLTRSNNDPPDFDIADIFKVMMTMTMIMMKMMTRINNDPQMRILILPTSSRCRRFFISDFQCSE